MLDLLAEFIGAYMRKLRRVRRSQRPNKEPTDVDLWIPRVVVGAIAVTAVIATSGAIYMGLHGNAVPNVVANLATDAFIILTILAPRPKDNL